MLRCINRLEHLTSGQIWIDDDQVTDHSSDIRKIREEVGMVFQSFNLFPHLTAAENIILARVSSRRSPRPKRASWASACSPVSACRKRKPRTLTSFPAASSSALRLPAPSR